MQHSQPSKRKHWWNGRTFRLIMAVAGVAFAAIFCTGIAGFIGLFVVATIAPYIAIHILIPHDKRRFADFLWLIYCSSFLITILLYEGFTVQTTVQANLSGLAYFFVGPVPARLIVSTLLGLLCGAALVILPLVVRAYGAVIWVLALNQIYEITKWQAFQLTVSLILGINRQIIFVEEGEIKEVSPQGWPVSVGGPALVIIRPYNAVVFEQAGRVTRVEGPGTVLMAFEERIKTTIDLRRQAAAFTAAKVLTRDRVPLHVTGGVGFRIQRIEDRVRPADVARMRSLDGISFLAAGKNVAKPEGDATHVLRQSVYNAAYGPRTGQKWCDRMKGDVETEMRKAFRAYNFNEIYNPNGPINEENGIRTTILDEIIQTVVNALRNSASAYGVHVFGASITTIQIEPQVETMHSAYFTALGAEWRWRLKISDADADNRILQDRAKIQSRILHEMQSVLQNLRTGLQEVAALVPSLPPEVVDGYLQVSERLLENVIIDNSTARRYLETMETLARVSPNTIIAAGMDVAQMSDFISPNLRPADSASQD